MKKRRYYSVDFAAMAMRLFRVTHAGLHMLNPMWRKLGVSRTERLMLAVEVPAKKLMFDCQMCGQCVLNETGLSCPMNCPKSLRNGPCGGVRANGNCEVKPDMRCVWVEAWRGANNADRVEQLQIVQKPVNHSLKGRSSWLASVEWDEDKAA